MKSVHIRLAVLSLLAVGAAPETRAQSMPNEVERKIEQYCSTHSPIYCSEFRAHTVYALGFCQKYRMAAFSIIGYSRLGWPPSLAIRTYRPGSTISDGDLAAIARDAYAAAGTATDAEFANAVYLACLEKTLPPD